jgi:hypothetical protein
MERYVPEIKDTFMERYVPEIKGSPTDSVDKALLRYQQMMDQGKSE